MGKNNTRCDFIMAFWRLYKDKPIERISIRELCSAAGYNRTTFYTYFNNIYQLLEEAIEELIEPAKDRISAVADIQAVFRKNIIEALFFDFFPDRRERVELLFKRQQHFLLREKMKEETVDIIRSKLGYYEDDIRDLEIILEYQTSAVFGVIRYWIQTDKQIPEQEIINKIYKISANGAFTCLNEEIGRL